MIHERGNELYKQDKTDLEEKSIPEKQQVLAFMKQHKGRRFAAFQLSDILDIREGNVRRVLSNHSKSDRTTRDRFGNFPITKRADRRVKDPRTRKFVATYSWNENYGFRPAQKNGQTTMFDPAPVHI